MAGCSAATIALSLFASGSATAAKPDIATVAKVSGAPVVLGAIIDDASVSSSGTASLVQTGEEMAVSYFNQNGGIAGHPIKLVLCQNQGTPSGAQNCANQMVQQNVAAVAVPFTGQGAVEVPIITKAGIPYVTLSGASTEELTTPGSFALSGGFPAVLGTDALDSKQKGYKKFAMLTEDVPAAIQGANVLGGMVFKNAGVGFKVIPVEPGTADITPQLQSAVSYGAQAIGITGDLTLCTSFLKAYQTLDLTTPKYLIGPCVDKSIFASLGSVLKGSLITTTSAAGPKDAKIYAAMTKYAKNTSPNPNVSQNQASGATSVWALVNVMNGYTGPVTAATIKTRLQTVKRVSLPLSGGLTFTCDGTAVPILKSVCSVATKLGTLTATGQVRNVKAFNSAPLYKSTS
jgi:branched-chain amino acid transport system substrate-binding protein